MTNRKTNSLDWLILIGMVLGLTIIAGGAIFKIPILAQIGSAIGGLTIIVPISLLSLVAYVAIRIRDHKEIF